MGWVSHRGTKRNWPRTKPQGKPGVAAEPPVASLDHRMTHMAEGCRGWLDAGAGTDRGPTVGAEKARRSRTLGSTSRALLPPPTRSTQSLCHPADPGRGTGLPDPTCGGTRLRVGM